MGGSFCVVDRQVISELCSRLFGVMRLGENGSSFELDINDLDGGQVFYLWLLNTSLGFWNLNIRISFFRPALGLIFLTPRRHFLERN